ncbi:MAG: polysaccharide pyruvyl transferase family protein [Limisphaerales bacterium]
MTLHSGFNEGAILQAYSLSATLNAMPDTEAEIVNIRYPEKSRVYGPPDNDRKKALDHAAREWLPTSPEEFADGHSPEYYRYLESRYDRLITGSDVVWTLRYQGRFRRFFKNGIFPRQCDPFFPAFPNAYWLPHCDNCTRVAYGASIGSFDWQGAPRRDVAAMGESLARFRAIGVRDDRTMDFVQKVCPDFAGTLQQTADPTFLIEDPFSEHHASATGKLEAAGIRSGDGGTVVFICNSDAKLGALGERFRAAGWQVVELTAPCGAGGIDLTKHDISPAEWTRIIASADLVVTERMHATIFSIRNHTPFVVIDPYERVPGEATKVTSLLKLFKLGAFRIAKIQADAKSIWPLVEAATATDAFDWESVDRRLAEVQESGRQFLRDSLSV